MDGVTAVIPFERASDLTREIDLVEEVGRIRGLNDIPAVLPRIAGNGRLTPSQARERRLARLAADLGLSEAITYRQVPESDLDALRIAGDDPAARAGAHGPPDERRDGRDAPLDAAGPAAGRRPQPAPPAHRRRPVRDRAHLRAPARRPGRRAPLPGGACASAATAPTAAGATRPAPWTSTPRPAWRRPWRARRACGWSRGPTRPPTSTRSARPACSPARTSSAGPRRCTRSCCGTSRWPARWPRSSSTSTPSIAPFRRPASTRTSSPCRSRTGTSRWWSPTASRPPTW